MNSIEAVALVMSNNRLGAEIVEEVLKVLLVDILNATAINHKSKLDGFVFVYEKAWCELCRIVAAFC